MFNDLDKAERRWRKKPLFRRRRALPLSWLLGAVMALGVAAVLWGPEPLSGWFS